MRDIIKTAQDNLKKDQNGWAEIYERAREDLFFLSDDPYAQWSQADYRERSTTGRPVITINMLSQFVHQVANDIRMNTPTINVIPADSAADQETAEVFKGIIRNIEYISCADDAYDLAANNSVKSGIGFIRVDHDFVGEEGFEQDLLIKRVVNPLACFIDCESVEVDGRDARRATILDQISVARFKELYPGKDPVSFDDARTDAYQARRDDDFITIAEYFEIVETERTIAADIFGNVIDAVEGVEYARTRKVKSRKVMRYKMSGKDILEETTFPGIYIPLVPVYGEEHWMEGKRHLLSLIRNSKQVQQMFNYWKSLETELLMKAPNAPVMAPVGSTEQFAEDWKNPNKSMVLRYETIDADGNPIPPPQRLEPPTIPTGVVNASRQTVDDIKATMGIYNASLGQRSNEQSGVAIAQRQQEGDVATFHFGDNLVRAITHVGRIIVNAAPEIYDTPRIMRIIGAEDEPKQIGINGQIAEDQEKPIDLRKGKYDIRVVTGAPFTTKRQEAAQFFTDIVTRQPEMLKIMGDLVFKYSDIAGADAMAERMKKYVDPQFLDEDEQQVDPEKQQMAALIQEGAAEIQALQEQLQSKEQSEQAKNEIEVMKLQMQAKEAEMEYQYKLAELELKRKELEIKEAELIAKVSAQTIAPQESEPSDTSATSYI